LEEKHLFTKSPFMPCLKRLLPVFAKGEIIPLYEEGADVCFKIMKAPSIFSESK